MNEIQKIEYNKKTKKLFKLFLIVTVITFTCLISSCNVYRIDKLRTEDKEAYLQKYCYVDGEYHYRQVSEVASPNDTVSWIITIFWLFTATQVVVSFFTGDWRITKTLVLISLLIVLGIA